MAGMKFELRRAAVKAMIIAQFPWVDCDTVFVYDHTDWEDPHFKAEFVDDGTTRTLEIKITIEEY